MTVLVQHFRSLAGALMLCLALIAAPAAAQDGTPVLREQVKVHSELVTLGDIFEQAGSVSEVAVFRSPDLGTKGVVSAERVKAAAQQHGLYWDNPGSVAQISVERPGRLVSIEDITQVVAEAASEELNMPRTDVEVVLDRRVREFHVDTRIEGPLLLKRMHMRPGGAFEAEVGFETSQYGNVAEAVRGRAFETMAVPVPTRPITRGETIPRADVKILRLPRNQLRGGIVLEEADLAGMAARRELAANEPVRSSDIEHPKLVTRNALVTVVYQTGGLLLRAQGIAQEDAHQGATVGVLNTRSKRVVQGIVRGPGLVVIESPSPTAALPQPDRRAQSNAGAGPRVLR